MAMFRAFKPEGLNKIAKAMGYQGDMKAFGTFLEENPDKQEQMQRYTNTAMRMAQGGLAFQLGDIAPARGQEGSNPPRLELTNPALPRPVNLDNTQSPTGVTSAQDISNIGVSRAQQTQSTPTNRNPAGQTIGTTTMQRMTTPGLPQGGVTQAAYTPSEEGQYIDPRGGQLVGSIQVPTAMATTAQAVVPTETQANLMQAQQATPAVDSALASVQASQLNPDDPRAKITAAQQTASSVGNLEAAQGQATLIESPVQRQIQQGELVSSVANAETASKFSEQIQAATATPTEKATVQGQLAQLTANFDATNPPSWAAGALRGVQAQMAQRGLGASSMAGQAMVQAVLESALPIAQADAQLQASFETQNLSNRQQRAMLAAQQRATFIGQEFDQEFQTRVQNAARISDISNQNFTAEQQVQLENSRLANTMNLNNLSNRQAIVVAEASALANMDLSNLNNRQQSAVQNAQSFLQMDMANLSNKQQTEMFKAQQRVQSMFTDAAAVNAASQFNATSQNQVDQFFSGLANQVSQFNATQSNAQAQFNAGQMNTVNRFNSEMNNQRDQFNAQNQLVIAQANAQWRRQIATQDTAAVNRANELNANAILDISKQAYSNLWQYYRDTMEWAWTSAESELDRMRDLSIAELDAKTKEQVQKSASSSQAGSAIGGLIGTVISGGLEHGFGNLFCWVAREVYGRDNVKWFIFRLWLRYDAPKWFVSLYGKYGKDYAKFISDKPMLKYITRKLMDYIIDTKRRSRYEQNA